jgi:ATP-dependent helicase YprA (DUF1998 family)
MIATIQETIGTLHETLLGYIEATYHIADPKVVLQRRRLLETAGGIFQSPFLESTPRYETGENYAQMTDIPAAAREAYQRLCDPSAGKPLLFDPPYSHQAASIRTILRDQRNLMIMTGTGSGKTESFLLPILGKLAVEAKNKCEQFRDHSAVRAMVLYPMNALVNDQLGRLRLLFGDTRVLSMFQEWSGRAATFARYTSRTPYAGVRSKKKDSKRLKSIGDFFVSIEEAAIRHQVGTPIVAKDDARAFTIKQTLEKRGKWPAKSSIAEWYGSGEWLDKQAQFRRAITLEDDAELLTRYEIQKAAPDLLITNYSMLEYMMLRPIERTIFDQTRAWLAACPDEKFLIVLDEAHLYRGAQGAEVGLLLRRLRERLDIAPERFQVICATASFSDRGKANAGQFGGQLSGAPADTFEPVTGKLKEREKASVGAGDDFSALSQVDLTKFFSENDADQAEAIAGFLSFRGIKPSANHAADLHAALKSYGPFSKLVNDTMSAARSFDEVRKLIFPEAGVDIGDRAINALIAMGSRARLEPNDASLLPCRVHVFYRGLPGLWACLDTQCSTLDPMERGGPIGRLYNQPHERCGCGAPVLPYFTCRYCGTSYARAYTKDVAKPDHLFADPGQKLLTTDGLASEFQALDLMLEAPPSVVQGLEANYDLVSGLLNPDVLSDRKRTVFLRPQTAGLNVSGLKETDPDVENDEDEDDGSAVASPGQFVPCGCCGRRARGGRSSVQDHVTKGDQPFEALVSAQIRVQPPGTAPATEFAPLRGRKVLVFSDSRQVAARLAPALQVFSLKDTLRALLPVGYRMLANDPAFGPTLRLESAWIAVVVAAHRFGVRLRPELEGASEVMPRVEDTAPKALPDSSALFALLAQKAPINLTRAIVDVLKDNILGLEPLAVASVREAAVLTKKLHDLPDIAGLAETTDQKEALVRFWLRAWLRKNGVWFSHMPDSWWGTDRIVKAHKGDFQSMKHVWSASAQKTFFKKHWLQLLMTYFTEATPAGHRLLARHLGLEIGGTWCRCNNCTSVHRPLDTVPRCIECGSLDVHAFNPDNDPVFKARKGFYRDPVIEALNVENPTLMSLIAAEHTAQLNSARPDEAFSQAEHHEMQFQDIDLAWREVDQHKSTSIDVLSSTTTMEVGIDIGELSGVALRNMPPGRANYQQRAGRAGRRGNAVATVVAFGSADSHDDHYFTEPQEMIRGQVVDPRLTLENPDIARRHIRAFLLQRYHEDRLPTLDLASDTLSNLFSVLGKVYEFRDGKGELSRDDLEVWLKANEAELAKAIDRWLPSELVGESRQYLITGFVNDLLGAIDVAIFGVHGTPVAIVEPEEPPMSGAPPWEGSESSGSTDGETTAANPEVDPQPDNDEIVDAAADNLLDRLLYWGVLPRYAFPTDIAPFYVFSSRSTGYRAEMEFAPSQGLNVALSQYAPNKQIWIKGKQYTSKAIYSPFKDDRKNSWGRRRMYYECSKCGHAKTNHDYDPDKRGEVLSCEACHSPATFGPAKPWFRPPGFAHLWGVAAPSVPDEPNETAYATRAKLIMPSGGPDMGSPVNPRLRALETRQHLLVSNSGPESKGYHYCTRCGRIESVSAPDFDLRLPHSLPYPNDGDGPCTGEFVTRGVVLGADFPTDVALFSLKLDPPFRLPPANSETQAAMRTICEALSMAACRLLQIESGEILAEYRPALNDSGAAGSLVEIFIYDTLAGGAGFSPQMVPRAAELFQTALKILEECPERCDASCYRCLRSFRNRLDHTLLDRYVGGQLLRHILDGGEPPLSKIRAGKSLALLANELDRQFGQQFEVIRTFEMQTPSPAPLILRNKANGAETFVDIHSPIAPTIRIFGSIGASVVVVDDLLVRRHLGEVVEKVAASL